MPAVGPIKTKLYNVGMKHQEKQEKQMLQHEDLEEAQEAINQIAEGFETLENIARSLPERDRRRFLNPDSFGPLNELLGKGGGYVAAYRGAEFHNFEDFISVLEDNLPEDDEDDEDDDFDEDLDP